MSSSEGGKVADALVTDINGGTFTTTFTAAVGYGLRLRLEDADTLRVDVAPVKSSGVRQDRGTIKWLNEIDIGIRYRFGVSDQVSATGLVKASAVDTYRYLLQQIVEWCYSNARLTTYANAVMPDDTDVRADVVQKNLEEWNQFTGLVRVMYQTETDIA